MAIPFLDLKAQYASIKPEIDAAVMGVLESCGFIGGETLKRFERNFASYMGAKHTVGSSGVVSELGAGKVEVTAAAVKVNNGALEVM